MRSLRPGGHRAISGGRDRSVRLWDVDTGKELRRFKGVAGPVFCAAFAPDGQTVFSGGGAKGASWFGTWSGQSRSAGWRGTAARSWRSLFPVTGVN